MTTVRLSTVEANIISAGCNRTSSAVDWGCNGIIAYGTSSSVALYQPMLSNAGTCGVLCTLVGHKKRVNCVKWIRSHQSASRDSHGELLVSGSVDQTAIVWTQTSHQPLQFDTGVTLRGHSGAVTSVDGIKTLDGSTVVATASADSTVKIWERSASDFTDVQTISYGNGFALDVSLATLPLSHGCLVLACAVTDHKVHLYTRSSPHQFVVVRRLSGHEDWVRCVAFSPHRSSGILLASSGQDHMIRVWLIQSRDSSTGTGSVPQEQSQTDITLQEDAFSVHTESGVCDYVVKLETVLSGHDNWLYSVCWRPQTYKGGAADDRPCLLSASMDKAMILWQADQHSGVWIDKVRVGEVGGNTLGFYGGLFSPEGDNILAHGYQGAFHQWHLSQDLECCTPAVTIKGHFDAVVDMAWEHNGHYLVTTSLDQTTRIYAPWIQNSTSTGWYEIARPQIHGYDMQTLAIVNSFCFASGADEKVIRVFEAPTNFLQNLSTISGVELSKHTQATHALPQGASVPALGLSNKAVFAGQTPDPCGDIDNVKIHKPLSELNFTPADLSEPPTEEHLLQNTLWPETQKLYGHSYELFALAASPDGRLLASACKATKPDYAGVIVWDTSSWRRVCTLDGPSLTITQLSFSPDSQHLLAVSRDRTWHLYRTSHDTGEYILVANTDKKTSIHTRIIWSACWSHDSVYFATASRDKKVAMWQRDQQGDDVTQNVTCGPALPTADAATAVDMAPVCIHHRYVVAIGLESGVISLHSWTPHPHTWTTLYTLDNRIAHTLTVKRLRFRPTNSRVEIGGQSEVNATGEGQQEFTDGDMLLQLASCSGDYSVRLYDLHFTQA